MFNLVIIFVLAILFLIYKLLVKKYDYWKIRNVPHLKPSLLFGNYKDYILLKKYYGHVAQEICKEYPDEPYIGTYYGTEPALLIKDPCILKNVLTKDFYYFNGREISNYTEKETVTNSLFFNAGDPWRVLRQNLTPIFTSAKIKMMFPLIKSCVSDLEKCLDKEVKMAGEVEAKSLLAKFTMDCIVSCAFGINGNALKENENFNPFVAISKKILDSSKFTGFKWIARAIWPSLFYGLKFRFFEKDIDNFFNHLMTGVFESRGYEQSSRNDFVDSILNWHKEKTLKGDSIENMVNTEKKFASMEVNKNLLISQCVLFFAAGFETTGATISFVLYNLAKNKHAQEKVIEEVDAYLAKQNGNIEYECVNEMPYMEACIDETLRLFPVLGVLTREVMDNYTLSSGLCLEKGLRIHIPIYHIHHNPDFFPEPEKFRPERFFGEEKKNIKPYTFLPFGEGPRGCIGIRFAKMPMYAGMITIFKKYRLELADDMPREIEFQPSAIATQAAGGIRVKFIPRG